VRARLGRGVAGRYAGLSFSQEGEDLILNRLFEARQRGFYVDVGAHHPYRFSNTFLFYLRGWSGLNIDPLPGTAALWARRRPDDLVAEVGIGDRAESRAYFVFDDPALNTFDATRAAELRRSSPYRQQSVREIAVRPLRDVLDEYVPPDTKIDFLSIDVEGLESEVFSTMDFERYRPDAICFERLNREPGTRLVGGTIGPMLDKHGFVFCSATVHSLIYITSELAQ
jgi:FkbM family methyltransferase